jgi:N-acetylmuramoyl-L-alanine amidase CwlA
MTRHFKGIAGRRNGRIRFVVLHDDAGSQNATSAFYRNWLTTHDATRGFAHAYCASDGTLFFEDEANHAWHTGNAEGNTWGYGIEVCQSRGDEAIYRRNFVTACKLAADVLKRNGLTANRNTVRLHREFSATSCPHRAWELFGSDVNRVKDAMIVEINKYMGGSAVASTPQPVPPKPQAPAFNPTLESHNKRFRVNGNNTNVRISQTTSSGVHRVVQSGFTFTSRRFVRNGATANGTAVWYEVQEIGGWISASVVTEVTSSSTPTPQPTVPQAPFKATGTVQFTQNGVNIRRGTAVTGAIVGQYNSGQRVIYDRIELHNGHWWVSFVGGSGNRNWISVTAPQTNALWARQV